jgi:hypothetical protein
MYHDVFKIENHGLFQVKRFSAGCEIIGFASDVSISCSGALVIPATIQGLRVTGIGEGAFRNCDAITELTIPGSVTCIGKGAFKNCKQLTSVTILNGVKKVKAHAFSGCSRLTKVSLPTSANLAYEIFKDCSPSLSITIVSKNKLDLFLFHLRHFATKIMYFGLRIFLCAFYICYFPFLFFGQLILRYLTNLNEATIETIHFLFIFFFLAIPFIYLVIRGKIKPGPEGRAPIE